MSTFEIEVTEDEISVEIGNAGGILSASLAKAGNAPILLGQVSASVVFTTALPGTFSQADWAIVGTVRNTVDSPLTVAVMNWWISAFTANGFTVSVNTPSDSGNYYFAWMLVPCVNG